MSLPTSKYSCEQLGVCQGDNPSCQMCAIEREVRRQTDDMERLDVWDLITFWLVVSLAFICTVITVAGCAGWLWGRFTQ